MVIIEIKHENVFIMLITIFLMIIMPKLTICNFALQVVSKLYCFNFNSRAFPTRNLGYRGKPHMNHIV